MSERIVLDQQLVNDIFNGIRRAVISLNGECYSNKDMVIYMPYYLKIALRVWVERQLTITEDVANQTFLVYGVEILNGYDQDKIIISNCKRDLLPDRVINHTLTIFENQVVYGIGLTY